MNVVYIQDQEIDYWNGNYYHSKSKHFFDRYLCGLTDLDTLTVYTGLRNIDTLNYAAKSNCVNNDRIKYVQVPEFRKLKNLYAIYKLMKTVVKEADFCYLRCGVASTFAGFFCIKRRKAYMTVMNEDIFNSCINHSSIIVKLAAYPLRFSTRYIVRHAKYSIYVTKNYLQEKYPYGGKMIGCSNLEFLDINETEKERRLQRIDTIGSRNSIVLGSAGSVSTVIKGHDTVIKALAILKKKGYANYQYQIVGKGNQDRLRTLANNLDVPEMVLFLGQYKHEDVLKWFDDVDIYLHPSRSEGLPRTILEAMTKALPCICSNVGGIPELINSNYLFGYNGNEVEKLSLLILKMTSDVMKKEGCRNFEKSKDYNPYKLAKERSDFFENAIRESRKDDNIL